LTVVQTSSPVPRQVANADTGKSQTVRNNADTNKKAPDQAKPVVQTVQPPPSQNANSSNGNENIGKTVRIREFPPVSVERDWMDCLALFFSALLLGVGIAGVVAAYRTLRAIEGQAGIMRGQITTMENQLAEMKRQNDLVISKERARIGIEIGELKINALSPRSYLATVECKITNLGAMKAFPADARYYLLVTKSKDGPQEVIIAPSFVAESVITPDQIITEHLLCFQGIGPETIREINDQAVFVHLKGSIPYTDVFGKYVTPFHYAWRAESGYAMATGVMLGKTLDLDKTLYGGWGRVGPESDNTPT
jgi:hypothetical protein